MTNPPIFKLPLDLKLAVSDISGIASESALAVTCKFLYRDLRNTMKGPCTGLRQRAHRLRFLNLLERDLPNKYLCLRCAKLHTWTTAWKNDGRWRGASMECCPAHGDINVLPTYMFERDFVCRHPGGDIIFDMSDMRLVMSRHMFGPEHGLPVKVLNRTRVYRHAESGIRVESTWRSLVSSGDELLMKTTHHTQGNLQMLSRFFCSDKASRLDLCCSTTMKSISGLIEQLDEIHKNESSTFPSRGPYKYSKYTTCWKRLTDIDIDIVLRETEDNSVHGSVNVSTFSSCSLDQVHHGYESERLTMGPIPAAWQPMCPYLRRGMRTTDEGRELRWNVRRSYREGHLEPQPSPEDDPFHIWPRGPGRKKTLWSSTMSRHMSR